MANTFGIFLDAALTVPLTGNLQATQAADGSTAPIQLQLFLGSLGSSGTDTTDRKLQADSNPGIANIELSVVDANPGSGHEATEVKLAALQTGLAAAMPGAVLSLGPTLISGTVNAAEFWVEIDDATGMIGTVDSELSIPTVLIRETAV